MFPRTYSQNDETDRLTVLRDPFEDAVTQINKMPSSSSWLSSKKSPSGSYHTDVPPMVLTVPSSLSVINERAGNTIIDPTRREPSVFSTIFVVTGPTSIVCHSMDCCMCIKEITYNSAKIRLKLAYAHKLSFATTVNPSSSEDNELCTRNNR